MNLFLLEEEKKEVKREGYPPSEIIEKSSKLSGDWLEKEIRKSFPAPPEEKEDKEPQESSGQSAKS